MEERKFSVQENIYKLCKIDLNRREDRMSEFRFPIYRKLANNKSFYRIDDEQSFFEIQIIGSKCFLTQTLANQYPEIIRIKDMLNLSEPFVASTIEEFHHYYTKSLGK